MFGRKKSSYEVKYWRCEERLALLERKNFRLDDENRTLKEAMLKALKEIGVIEDKPAVKATDE